MICTDWATVAVVLILTVGTLVIVGWTVERQAARIVPEESMTQPTDSLEAALEQVPLYRIMLRAGIVADYDGAYDWIKTGSIDPKDSVGEYPATWPGESYSVVAVADLDALAAAAREWMREQMPIRRTLTDWRNTSPEEIRGYNTALDDVARALGL